ncbi:hypothetical protein CPS_4269 [Colwellia psychrerythraea 34H]|uniref:Uncharacterized protein n=1 Tax=Colwellia psychrerythraea (strain 34H / ATCC BAA-681) TaxID=167879 RepID=Q47WA3_COLP3|nr:hypothetical protein CPS_4269 [Colwellia psychrerythraea 34H]
MIILTFLSLCKIMFSFVFLFNNNWQYFIVLLFGDTLVRY